MKPATVRVAIHEASHAVVAYVHGAVFTGPLIVYPDRGYADQMDKAALTEEQRLEVLAAGIAGELLAFDDHDSGGQDWFAARLWYGCTEEQFMGDVERAAIILADHWPAVVALIMALRPQFDDPDCVALIVPPDEIPSVIAEARAACVV